MMSHRSAGVPNNERLEFLGEGVVGLIVAEALYKRWPKADEGALTRARAELVRESSLAAIARALALGPKLILGPGAMKSGGPRRAAILSDSLEARVGASSLAGGLGPCCSAEERAAGKELVQYCRPTVTASTYKKKQQKQT